MIEYFEENFFMCAWSNTFSLILWPWWIPPRVSIKLKNQIQSQHQNKKDGAKKKTFLNFHR